MSNFDIIFAFVNWAYNFDSSLSWIDEIEWGCDSEHIKEKFRDSFDYCGNAGVMVYWFGQLDKYNQKQFIDWLLKKFNK